MKLLTDYPEKYARKRILETDIPAWGIFILLPRSWSAEKADRRWPVIERVVARVGYEDVETWDDWKHGFFNVGATYPGGSWNAIQTILPSLKTKWPGIRVIAWPDCTRPGAEEEGTYGWPKNFHKVRL